MVERGLPLPMIKPSLKLARTFHDLRPFTALVIGDFLLDTYTIGRVRRISPEAPVPVMEVANFEERPGGAGNVVLGLLALGASVIALGRIGDDSPGARLQEALASAGANASPLLREKGYQTPVKNRLIAESQQLLRVDFETRTPLPPSLEELLLAEVKACLPHVQVIALSDYGKGLFTESLLSQILSLAREASVPTVVDPKGVDFRKYRGATLLKPNLSEAYAASKLPPTASLDEVASSLFSLSHVSKLLITRSEQGISLFDPNGERSDFPVRSKEVKDVTGAGDTVLAVIALTLANGIPLEQGVQLANIAAGLAIERIGCAQITLAEIASRLLEYDCDLKVFDEHHTYALTQVLQGKRYLLLVLEAHQKMTEELFRAIRQVRGEGELIIYLKNPTPRPEFLHLLSSLPEVSYIVLQTESLRHLLEEIDPHEVYFFAEESLEKRGGAKELLAALLGRVGEVFR